MSVPIDLSSDENARHGRFGSVRRPGDRERGSASAARGGATTRMPKRTRATTGKTSSDERSLEPFPRGGARDVDADEDAFPRGGGGGDDGDAERSERGQKRRARGSGGVDEDDDNVGDDFDDDPFASIARAARGASSRSSGAGGGAKYVETLKYKSLRSGVKLLGVVSEVTARGLVMSLPDGLRGTVARAEASDVFRGATRSAGAESADDESESSDDEFEGEEETISLESLYEPGQVLRCVVLSLDKGKTGGKRIELSLRLENVCAGIDKDSLVEGSVAPAMVRSIEDHGYILDFGIAGTSGFLPKKSVANDLTIRRGKILDVVITATPTGNKGYFTVTSDQKRVTSSVSHETSATNVSTLLPGMLVNSRVKQVLADGILCSFMTFFSGTVDCFQTGSVATTKGVASAFKVGQRMRARVIFVDAVAKRVCLTLLPHLLEHTSITLPKLGKVFQTATIARVDAGQGVALSVSDGDDHIAAYAHVSQLSDERVEKVEKKFKIGRSVNVRVIGHRLMDGIVSVSLKSSVMAQPFFSLEELTPGMLVNGEVVAVEHYGAIVKLAEGIKALCPPLHVSDIVGRTTSSKVSPGAKLKFRVLNVDKNSRRATVSHKRTLIKSELPVIASLEDALPGAVTHGVVTGVNEYGVFISLYGDLRGLANVNDLGLLSDQKPSDAFGVGQVVRVTIVSADASGRLRLSLAAGVALEAKTPGLMINASAADLTPGIIVETAVVTHVSAQTGNVEVVFTAEKGNVPGIIALAHLSDHPLTATGLSSVLNPGDKIGPLVVLEGKPTRAVLSRKLSLVESSQNSKLPASAEEATPGSVFPGYVASATSAGVFVRFLGKLTGLAPPSQLVDGVSADIHDMFPVGKTVNALVLAVDTSTSPPRLSLSLKLSATSSPLSDAPLIRSFFNDIELLDERVTNADDVGISPETAKSLQPGTWMDVTVNETKEYGVLMDMAIDSNAVGLVTPHQLPESVEFESGDAVKCYVLDVSRREGVVDMGMRSGLERFKRNKTASGKSLKRLKVGDEVTADVELVKAEYAVFSLPDHSGLIGYASVHHLNRSYEDATQRFTPAQRVKAIVAQLPDGANGRLLLTVPVTISSSGGKIAAGTLVKGVVSEIQPLQALVALPNNARGRLYISEFDLTEEKPLASVSVGSTIEATVLGLAGERGGLLDLSVHRKSAFSLDGVSVGDSLNAYVLSITQDGLKVTVAAGVTSFIPKIETSDKASELSESLETRFVIGQRVRATAVDIKLNKRRIDLTLRTESVFGSNKVCVGAKLHGIVTRVVKHAGVMVQIGSHSFGRIHLTDLSDELKEEPSASYAAGAVVQVRVLNVSPSGEIDLSTRASRMSSKKILPEDAEVQDVATLVPGQRIKGYVKATTKKGCFVALSRSIDAMCKLSNLADDFIADPIASFPPGKLVQGRIVSADAAKGRVEISLRERENSSQGNADVSGVDVGSVMMGTVRRVQPYGVFIGLDGTKLSGLCHISMFADARINDDLSLHVRQGERVRVKVLEINAETKKISLGCKASLFEDDDKNDEDEDHEMEDAQNPTLDPLMDVDGESDDDDDDDDVNEDDSDEELDGDSEEDHDDEENGNSEEEEGMIAKSDEESDEESDEDVEDDASESDDAAGDMSASDANDSDGEASDSEDEPIGKDLSFDWGATENEIRPVNVDSDYPDDAKPLSKREKKRLKEAKELEILQKEQALRDGDAVPESAMEFEKLLIASPRSSFLWVRYMAFHVSCGAYAEAREVAERAIVAIPASEETERMNIWAAYLNLENKYGTPTPEEAVKKLFTRAVQLSNAKHLHMTLISMYERNGQQQSLEDALKKAAKKFSYSTKVWLAYIRAAILKGNSEWARQLLDRATQALPKHKHIKILMRTALFEMKEGNPERGRTMFEGILRNYPRRTDIWSVYIDQEIKQGDLLRIRALFERATHLDLNAKSMKFLFKRYLDFERSEGDDERIAHVKQRAMEYVSNKFG